VSKGVKLPVVELTRTIVRYHTDPSGTFVRYEAKAIGSGSEAAQSELQDKWHKVRRRIL
jgi:20S proteasome alpha/beta subunit